MSDPQHFVVQQFLADAWKDIMVFDHPVLATGWFLKMCESGVYRIVKQSYHRRFWLIRRPLTEEVFRVSGSALPS